MQESEVQIIQNAVRNFGLAHVAKMLGVSPETVACVCFGTGQQRTIAKVRRGLGTLQRAISALPRPEA